MAERWRHGLHVVGDPPPATPLRPAGHAGRRLSLRLHQQSVVLKVAGRLNADTCGRLRMFLSIFTLDGGPRELVLDLSDVYAVDEEGMAPIFEADESMRLRRATLRLMPLSAAVVHFLADARCDRAIATGPLPGGE